MPVARITLERHWPGMLEGWSADASVNPGELQLLLRGKPVADVVLQRHSRADVKAALGGQGDDAYGFSVYLTPHLARCAAAGDLRLRQGSVELALPIAGSMEQWANFLRELPDGDAREESVLWLMHHVAVAGGPSKLLGPAADWLRQEARARHLENELTQPDSALARHVPSPLRGQIESMEGLVLAGWLQLDATSGQALCLRTPSGNLSASVIRVHRDDVRAALGLQDPMLGFELELPAGIWRHRDSAGACQFRLAVGSRSLPPLPRRLDVSHLVSHFGRLAALPVLELAGFEGQYQVMQALEHLAAAEAWDLLPDLLMRFARRQAERFGLTNLLPAQATLPDRSPMVLPQPDQATMRQLQRALSDEMGQPGATAATSLKAVLARHPVAGEVQDRFLRALIPVFAGQRDYASLRPLLRVSQLRELADSDEVWSLSQLLPELVATSDYNAAATLVKRLVKGKSGWLNTECVGQAADLLLQELGSSSVDDRQALKLVEKFLALLASMSEAGYWGRLHDQHIVDAQVSLLLLAPVLPANAAYAVLQSCLKLFALVPSFWTRLESRWPAGLLWPPELRSVHRGFVSVSEGLRSDLSPTRAQALLLQLQPFRACGNIDVPQFSRDILQAAVPQLDTEVAADVLPLWAETDGLGASESLRLAAHPLLPPALLAGKDDLVDRMRAAGGVTQRAGRELQQRLLRELRTLASDATQPLPSLATCRRLAGPAHDFVGVQLAAWRWCIGRVRWDAAQVDAELSELRAWWMTAHMSLPVTPCGAVIAQPSHAVPAPLCNALLLLQATPAAKGSLQESLVQEFLSVLPAEDAWALTLPTGEALRFASPAWSSRTLVVVYSCRANLATRVERIRQTWGRDLTARGIPWLIAVGDGHGQIEPDGVLGLRVSDHYEDLPAKSLALIDWVWRHTNFDHLYKIDDDCHLAVDAFFDLCPHWGAHYLGRPLHRAEGGTDRRWHQAKSHDARAANAIDKSPEPSVYADGGTGYLLSRLAMGRLCKLLQTTRGARLTRSVFMEDKLVGDLLRAADIPLTDAGYETLLRRKLGHNAVPVNCWQNTFYPGPLSPTMLTHLDDANALDAVHQGLSQAVVAPLRIWPTCQAPSLTDRHGKASGQLELLSPASVVRAMHEQAELLVVAVARNERVLMPHFLQHYRKLGVRHFVLIDNLSDDGTREYLLSQPDVVLYSVDSQYRLSHYGVAWQQAVLAAHGLGRWAVLADIDEFMVFEGCEQTPLLDWLRQQQAQGFDGVRGGMIDMYPAGSLTSADFEQVAPFDAAPYFDRHPLLPWRLGSGWYSNAPSTVSALRHRLIPGSAPNQYTSQKLIALRYMPWVRLSQGVHYASGVKVSPQHAWLAHFKYHAGFARKVQEEVARKQHFNGAEEYRQYMSLLAEASGTLYSTVHSTRYVDSSSFTGLMPDVGLR
ncbi:glycosyltransferase family 2 protein [Ideonella sp.]|uniref:glycosyltransferase family 2 protein n=2 Tax=Ideonella sp. TaxID=1929293 RepID=UPI002D7FF0BA|nr:glycosyltransferase family 2 protein [Ideonella sp.]